MNKRRFDPHVVPLTVAALSLMLGGCGILQSIGLLPKPPEPAPVAPVEVPLSEQAYDITLVLTAASDINPDADTRPSPVKTLVFLTEPAQDLGNRPFESLFSLDGTDIDPRPIATVVLQPGAQKILLLSGVKSQSRLSIAAAFRNPYRTRWMASRIVEPRDTLQISAFVNALNVEIGDAE